MPRARDGKEIRNKSLGSWGPRTLLSEGMELQVGGIAWQRQLSVKSEILLEKLKRNSQAGLPLGSAET